MILGGTPYYIHTVTTAFNASPGVHKIYRFVKAGTAVFGIGDSAVFKSTDDGETWTSTNLSYPSYHLTPDARISNDGTTLFVWDPNNTNFGNEVLKSTDAGNTWTSSGYQQPDGYAFLVHNGVAYGSSVLGLQYSADNGNNWLYVTTIGSTVNDIVAFGDTIFAATNMGVFKSSDNGLHWSAGLQQNTLCLCVAGTSLLCGTQKMGVWQTDINALYWFSKSDDLPYAASGDLQPVTSLSFNDFYVMANVRFDTLSTVIHYLYTMPIIALNTPNVQPDIADITLYPNPVRDELFIRADKPLTGDVQVSLFDLQGRMLKNSRFNNTATMSLKIGNIPTGIYLVNISNNKTTISRRIQVAN
jgi:hypothetical protein